MVPDKRLERALRRIRLLEREIDGTASLPVSNDLIELRNLVLTAHLIVRCARQRKEDRGLHFSRDYPVHMHLTARRCMPCCCVRGHSAAESQVCSTSARQRSHSRRQRKSS